MQKILKAMAGALAVVSFTITMILAYKTWTKKAIQGTADEEIRQGIQYGEERFKARVQEKIEEIAGAKAEEITKRWNERFNVGGQG